MPPARTHQSRLDSDSSSDANAQRSWSLSTETASIAFAPNVTPVTFNDPPPMFEPACEAKLFPPTDDCPAPRRPGHSKKKPDNHIPRPPNAFILFRSSFIKSQHVSTEVETNHSTLSKIIGLTWQNLPHDERQVWHAKAKAALEEHKRKFPQYAFRPLHTKGRGPEKRKVREVGPKDLKRCAKIAQLLVEGKKGSELDAAVQEFDRHHVPEIVTRFETPLTAKQYRRRSSSVPIPDSVEPPSKKPKATASARRIRACSSQPSSKSSTSDLALQELQDTWQTTDVESPVSTTYNSPSPVSDSSSTYSFLQTPESSYDFTSFSFDQSVPATAILPCSPLEAAPEAGHYNLFDTPLLHPPAPQSRNRFENLSINTSFMDDWTRSSSPMSSSMPATPQSFIDSPCCVQSLSPLEANADHFATAFNFDTFDQHSLHKSFDLPTHLQIYPNDTVNTPYISHEFVAPLSTTNTTTTTPTTKNHHHHHHHHHHGYATFEQLAKPDHRMELDFSSLVASLPPYTI